LSVLWDCVTLIDDATVSAIREFGGVSAIAISHPHYYSTMVEWSRALGGIPVLIHEADRAWVMRSGACVTFWAGETKEIGSQLTLIRCGGHFDGGQVMHSAAGNALFTGDVIQVCPDRRWVSFMRSYPNYIPLPESSVRAIAGAVEPFEFDRLYGAWPKHEIVTGAKEAVRRSAERYVRALKEVIR
jgi:glyoxylase-like metal-dependent hydrolase (beta-lactamase superfamily II)